MWRRLKHYAKEPEITVAVDNRVKVIGEGKYETELVVNYKKFIYNFIIRTKVNNL